MAKQAADGQEMAEEFKNSLNVLRRRRLFFAIGMNGSTPVIKTHIKQKPKKLRKDTKGLGAGPKGCSGEMTLNGKVLELYCIEENVPDTIVKQTTKWLRSAGMQLRVEIMPGVIAEPQDEEEVAGAEGEAVVGRAASAAEAPTEAPAREGPGAAAPEEAAEEAAEALQEAGIRTAAHSPGGRAPAAQEEEEPVAASTAAPAGRTADQEQLLTGLRDMKTLLQQVGQQGRKDDLVRMQKFGDLFKKAVKQNDARVGQKVLDGMRQLATQVDANAQAARKRGQARAGRLKQMSASLKNLIRELG